MVQIQPSGKTQIVLKSPLRSWGMVQIQPSGKTQIVLKIPPAQLGDGSDPA